MTWFVELPWRFQTAADGRAAFLLSLGFPFSRWQMNLFMTWKQFWASLARWMGHGLPMALEHWMRIVISFPDSPRCTIAFRQTYELGFRFKRILINQGSLKKGNSVSTESLQESARKLSKDIKGSLVRKLPSYRRMSMIRLVLMSHSCQPQR